jgi:hypothetical protein
MWNVAQKIPGYVHCSKKNNITNPEGLHDESHLIFAGKPLPNYLSTILKR